MSQVRIPSPILAGNIVSSDPVLAEINPLFLLRAFISSAVMSPTSSSTISEPLGIDMDIRKFALVGDSETDLLITRDALLYLKLKANE